VILLRLIVLLLAAAVSVDTQALTRVLIFTGIPGEAAFETAFQQQSSALAQALSATGSEVESYTDERSNAAAMRGALSAAASLGVNDQLILIYIGHGSYDGRAFKLNLHGPDVSATQLAGWLEPVAAAQLVILASAASGAALEVMAAERRTMMTATRSGDQSNVTVFGHYLSMALEDPAGDLNKDRELSLQEVFDLVTKKVADHYETRRLMATEHPQLINARPGFTMSYLGAVPLDPATEMLRSRRSDTEAAIAGLQARKSDLSPESYFEQLQQLLLELAVIEQEIERVASDSSAGEL
jgi:hypothetical protein